MRLEELVPGLRVHGLAAHPVDVVSTTWVGGDYLQIAIRHPDGATDELLVDRDTEQDLASVNTDGRDNYAGDASAWKRGAEALRIRHAALVDPMLAVSSSSLQPLPHQIKAVYGEFLPRTPLRYLLADDPGAGKTIMCGLYVKELILRGDLERCLIVAPGGLVDQWVGELWEKFGLKFAVLTKELISTTVGGTVFEDNPLLIARMDMLSRNEDLQAKLENSTWDLVVVDEAHRMSARFNGRVLDTTKRYNLGKALGKLTRNLLLMTATPHNGDSSAFQAFLALLDADRFAGTGKGVTAPGTDLMRRMLKEELLTMDGKPLFPERRARTITYSLTRSERDLYDAVSDYVRHEMNRAEILRKSGDGLRARNVGFALTVLQRRLASSPESILRSLQRRRARLQRLREEATDTTSSRVLVATELTTARVPAADDTADFDSQATEEAEGLFADAASAAQSLAELDHEIATLGELLTIALGVRRSATDCKWLELRSILETDELMRDDDGNSRKIIIFTEHRDTLSYLSERIRELPSHQHSVVEIHGGLTRSKRVAVQKQFITDPDTTVLVATDAAGEGLNLQCAHLMVNYDLPWNPNRIEQRFGRIHRIGQTEVCHLWNLVSADTREGDVFHRLLTKMDEQAKAYRGKVFDVLGEAFGDTSLEDLLVEAIRHGDDPEVRAKLDKVIDKTVGDGIPELVERRALYSEVLQQVDVEQARERIEASARTRLQPHFAETWFVDAFKEIGGRARRRSDGTWEITHVPEDVRATARAANGARVHQRYAAVSFDPARDSDLDQQAPDQLGPGHALLDSVADAVADNAQRSLRDGVVLVDDRDHSRTMRLFCAVSHELADGGVSPQVLSRRVAFVEIDEDGSANEVGPTYLDYRAADTDELPAVDDHLVASRFGQGGETAAKKWALEQLVPDHIATVRDSHATATMRSRQEIAERLGAETAYWRERATRPPRSTDTESPESSRRRADDLQTRMDRRLAEISQRERVVARPPVILACALVVPAGLLHGDAVEPADVALAEAALRTVSETERHLGRDIVEIKHGRCPVLRTRDERGVTHWIEVMTAPSSGRTVQVSRTQVLYARNLGDRYRLALVDPSVRAKAPGQDVALKYAATPFGRVRFDGLDQHQVDVPWSSLWRSAGEPA